MRATQEQRLLAKTVKGDGCWEWQGYTNERGYGTLHIDGGSRMAHRVAYETWVGPVPLCDDVHHTCSNRLCVNPAHLVALSRAEHRLLHAAQRTTCPAGHPYTEIKRGHRWCRTCHNEQRRVARRAA